MTVPSVPDRVWRVISWGRLVPGAVIERKDGRLFRVLALDQETPGRVLLSDPVGEQQPFEVTRDVRSQVRAGIPTDVVAAEYAARALPATIVQPPVPNSRLALHLYHMHDIYTEPKMAKDYAELRRLHDLAHAERQFYVPHEHRQKEA